MFKGRNDWMELWVEDKESMMDTMIRNMKADLDAGYNYFGNSIVKQREAIEAYKKDYDETIMSFAGMDEKYINKWCYLDMKRRGAID